MQKYGWTAGKGLGASSSGIVNPLRVQVEKRRKKADADGGGWAEPGGKGKIIGGRRADGEKDGGKFGRMSEVIVLGNMLDNMPDLQREMEDGLGQEIGEECGEKVCCFEAGAELELLTDDSMAAWKGYTLTRRTGKFSSSSRIKSRRCE